MEKVKKWRKSLALILTVVMMTQNIQVLNAGTTTAELDARTGSTTVEEQMSVPSQEQIDVRAAGGQYEDLGNSEIADLYTDGTEFAMSDSTDVPQSPISVTSEIKQEVYRQEIDGYVYNFVQMTANVTNNDTEHDAVGVNVKVLLPEQLSYVTVNETPQMSGFNSPFEAINYGFDLNEVPEEVLVNYNGQVIMWINQVIGAGECTKYTFTTQLPNDITDVTGVNAAWYVGGAAQAYEWVNAEILVPAEPETPTEPEIPVEPEIPTEPEITETPVEPEGTEDSETPTEPEDTETPEELTDLELTELPETSAEEQEKINQLMSQRAVFALDEEEMVELGDGAEDVPEAYAANKDILATGNTVDFTLMVNGRPVGDMSNISISRDDKISMLLSYQYSEENKPTVNDYSGFYYALPVRFDLVISQKNTGPITDKKGVTIGSYEINDAENRVYFSYDPAWIEKHPNEIGGTFKLTMDVNKESTKEDQQIEITFPGMDGAITIGLDKSKVTGSKTYTVDEQGNIVFKVVLTPDSANVTNIVVTDTLTGNLIFNKESFSAEIAGGTNPSTFTPEVIFDNSDYPKTATVTIGDLEYGQTCILTYTAKPTDISDGGFSARNNAGWTWNGIGGTGETGSGGASVDVDIEKNILGKEGIFDEELNQITYTIPINELRANLITPDTGNDRVVLTDIMHPRVTLISSSVSITGGNGSSVPGAVHSYNPATRTLRVEIPDETYVMLTYTVQVNGEVGESVTITNRAELNGSTTITTETENEVVIQDSVATGYGKQGTLTINKTGLYSVGGNIPDLPGATFELYKVDLKANPVDFTGTLIETQTTDETGEIVFGDTDLTRLSKDELYYYKEITAPNGYIPDSTKTYFAFSESSDVFKTLVSNKCSGLNVVYYGDGDSTQVANDTIPASVNDSFIAKKTVDGVAATGNEFKFKAELTNYAPKTGGYVPGNPGTEGKNSPAYSQEVSNNGESVTFPAMTFEFEGTYTFRVSEVVGNGNYTYDAAHYDVVIVVNRNQTTGNLEITSKTFKKDNNTVNEMLFNNITLTSFSLQKKTTTAVKADTTFSFKVSNNGGDIAANFAANNVSGENVSNVKVENNVLTFEVKVSKDTTESPVVTVTGIPVGANLKVEEINLPSGWAMKSSSKANLTIVQDASSNNVEFTNEYGASSEWIPEGTKTLTGRDFRENEEFTFVVLEKGTEQEVSRGTAKANGKIEFTKVTYKEPGVHNYIVKELQVSEIGMAYDTRAYEVTVTVTDEMNNGELTVNVGNYICNGDNKSVAEFVNSYTASGEWTPRGSKMLTGGAQYNETVFNFEVKEDNVVKTTGTVSEDGGISFGTIEYTQEHIGEHVYTINEVVGDRNDISYDRTVYNIKVIVTDGGNGNLKATEQKYTVSGKEGEFEEAAFTNTYKAGGSWTPEGTKNFEGRDYQTGEAFRFKVVNDATNEIVSRGYADATTNGQIKFDSVEFDQTDIGETYEYTISEIVENKAGIEFDKTQYHVTVSITAGEEAGRLNVSAVCEAGQISFTNKYDASTTWTPQGTKTLTGRNYKEAEKFEFVVKEQLENDVFEIVSKGYADVTTNGKIAFETISYDLEDVGEHYYNIYEVFDERVENGLTHDDRSYRVVVSVSDKGNGTLEATVINHSGRDNIAAFENIYNATGHWTPAGTKNLTGRDYKAGEKFTYTVKENGAVVSTGENTADGNITFTQINYELDDKGPHHYVISENKGTDTGIAYDETEYHVTVTVSDSGNGTLVTDVSKYTAEGKVDSDEAIFENKYTAHGEWTIEGTKNFTGREYLEEETFTYVIKEGNTVKSNGVSGADGKVTFEPIKYTMEDLGKHAYVISEVPGTNSGIDYDETTYTVVVNVTDAGNGVITAEAEGTLPEIVFNNTYAAKIQWTPTGTKILTGRDYKDGEVFNYVVMEGEKAVAKGTSSNGKDGETLDITFDTIGYVKNAETDNTGEHIYIISELPGDDDGVAYDQTLFTVVVNVEDNGDGTMTAAVVESDSQTIAFHNVYSAEGEWTPIGTKDLVGREYREGEVFTYEVKDEAGKVVEGHNDKNGAITFDKVVYELEDAGHTYKYTISEVPGRDVGTDYDAAVYEVEVTVTDLGEGQLKAEAVYTKGAVQFKNTYGAMGYWKPEGTKTLTGREYQPGETFYYHVTDKATGEVVSTGWNLKNGSINFTRVDYDENDVGVHTYEISEVDYGKDGIAYDKTIFTVKVAVSDAERGKLKAEVEYVDGKVEFINNSIHFRVKKVELGSGKEVAGAELTVYGKDENGNFTKVLGSWTSKEGEVYDFGHLLSAGQDYLLKETVAPDGYFYTSDIEFRVEEDGTITTTAKKTTDESGNDVYLVEDTRNQIAISKKAITGTDDINGAVLQIKEGEKVILTFKSETAPYPVGNVLEIGKVYTLSEVSTPDGYLLTEKEIQFKIEADGTVTAVNEEDSDAVADGVVTLRDVPRTVKILKKDTSGNVLTGAKLQILDKDGNIIEKTWETTAEAHVVEARLKVDETYILKEIDAPTGYTIADDIEFKVDDKTETVEIVMEDTPTKVVISKKAITGTESLGGAELRVVDGDNRVIVEKWTTEAGKDVTVEGKLDTGVQYYLEEVKAPDGYAKADRIPFKFNEKGEVVVNDKAEVMLIMRDAKTRIKVSKTDITGEEELVGAVLQIFEKTDTDKKNPIAEWKTDGKVHYVEGLVVGRTYILYEKLAPEGYAYADDVEFTVREDSIEGNEQHVTMSDEKNAVFISKKDITGTKELPGAKLELRELNGKVLESWTSTSEEHKITVKLEAGKEYIIHEVTAPDGYAVAEDVKFTVNKDGKPTHAVMKDAPTKVEILKVDEKGVALSGATLVIKDHKGVEIDRWVSDSKAHVIEGKLIENAEYTLSEIEVPQGYILAKDIKFTVKGSDTIKVTMENLPNKGKGKIIVTKKVSFRDDLDIFDITAKDDTFYVNIFTDKAGTHPYGGSAPKAIRLVNASSGSVIFDNLPDGIYYVFETDAAGKPIPYGELQNLNGKEFVCNAENDVTSATLDLKAGDKEGHINLENVFYELPDGYPDAYIDISKQVLKGTSATTVKDTFYAGIFTKDGEGVYNLFTVATLVQNGTVRVKVPLGGEKGDQPIKYYILETDAKGNIVDLDEFEYEVSGEGTVSLSKKHNIGEINIINKLPVDQDGKILIQKVDGGGVGLAGASFRITDTKGTVVKEWTSAASAQEVILRPGKYTLTELKAPEGYKGAGSLTITVGKDSSINIEGSGVEFSYYSNVLKYVNRPEKTTTTGGGGGGGGGYTSSPRYINTLGKASAKTGDDTPVELYVLLLAAAALALTGTAFARKKRNK